jgi:hypothetical protein
MNRKAHWDEIYTTKAPDAVSWFEPEPTASLRLLDAAGMTINSSGAYIRTRGVPTHVTSGLSRR